MADYKISDITIAASTLDGTELVEVEQGGNSRKTTTKAVGVAGVIGKQGIWIPATGMIANTTSGPASVTVETTTNKVMLPTFDFDAATKEGVQFALRMPKQWNEGTVSFVAVWKHGSTTTNFKVAWDLAGVACSDQDAGDAAFGTVQQVNDTGGTTNTIYHSPESSAMTIAGTPAAEDLVFFRLRRVADDATNDTLAIDAGLLGIMLYITVDAGNDA